MYTTSVPSTVNRIIVVFYALKLWNIDEKATFYETGVKLFHFVFYVSFVSSFVVRICLTDNGDEFVVFTVLFIIAGVHIFRLDYIISKKRETLKLIFELGIHSTNNVEKFHKVEHTLANCMNFVKCFISVCLIVPLLFFTFPLIFNGKMLINFAFPLDGKSNWISFWIKNLFLVVGCLYAILCFLISVIIWYLMVNCAIKYDLLGDQLRNMGVVVETKTLKILKKATQPNSFMKSFIEAIQTHQKVNK